MHGNASPIESRARAAKVGRGPEAILALMMPTLVAARLGGWKDNEAVACAYARALGWESRDLLMALQSRDRADLRTRHATAVHRLFGEAGVDLNNALAELWPNRAARPKALNNALPEHLAEAIDKMVTGLPDRLRSFSMPMAAMSYFSIFRSTNLPASAGSYSVFSSRRRKVAAA
jgi:hypothetical protein